MPVDRLEALKNLIEANPKEQFARFGLAMEYAKAGRMEEAVGEFQVLLELNPDYWGAYYHLGQALEQAGRYDEAREAYRRGMEVAGRLGQAKARSELEAALEILGVC